MKSDGIPASITLAQAMLESANGNSSLARFANNHFGIKCTPDWKGKKYYKDDDKRNDCFRVYKDPESSFYDHTEFLKRPRYQALFKLKSTDYKGWAHGLKKCGYATDPNYPQMLINLIERYDLHKYDRRGKRKQIAKSHQNNSPTTKSKSGSTPSNGRYHTVEQGDTLYRISQKYGIPVEQLMRINNLRNSTIYPGQKLNIP